MIGLSFSFSGAGWIMIVGSVNQVPPLGFRIEDRCVPKFFCFGNIARCFCKHFKLGNRYQVFVEEEGFDLKYFRRFGDGVSSGELTALYQHHVRWNGWCVIKKERAQSQQGNSLEVYVLC